MGKKKIDPVFKKRFGINSHIVYIPDVKIQRGCEEEFRSIWRNFYPKAKPLVSETREERLLPCLRRIQREGTDEFYCKRITISYINRNVGYGVFATENIPPYSTLIHYAGILRPECSIKESNDSTFAFTDFKEFSIDAAKYGNWARFMNHGEGKKINVVPWEVYLPEGPRIVFTAGQNGIKKGQQLLYSYGDEYWEEKEFHLL